MYKVKNIQHRYLNNRKATVFDVYRLQGHAYIFNRTEQVNGHHTKPKTLLRKVGEKTKLKLMGF